MNTFVKGNTPVVLSVFARPDKFKHVFKAVQKIKPKIIYVISDGPRVNIVGEADLVNQSREIVNAIDWDCKVIRYYETQNRGMYYMVYHYFAEIFKLEDRFIFLEDDIVISKGFYTFCDELLEKYKNDHRVNMICGMNHLVTWDEIDADYLFSKQGSIWGFALWKRSFEQAIQSLNYLNDKDGRRLMDQNVFPWNRKSFIDTPESRLKNIQTYGDIYPYEFMMEADRCVNDTVLIVPKRNMVKCIGLSSNSAHAPNSYILLSQRIRQLFYMKTYDINSTIKHPNYLARDLKYEQKVIEIMGRGSFSTALKYIERVRTIFVRLLIAFGFKFYNSKYDDKNIG